ncbi:MAG: hypothetical protein C5B55_00560 [Blastocatellia bacterium]|nr:MAG: hypothetical protein C5B55_00560 [Blastocatellia bacterium]
MIGQTVSHYRVVEKLGEGGMGVVYVAEDLHLARRVAIKFLSSTDRHYRARFIREARAVSALNHPNIATVHDYGETTEGTPFIVMEYVKGSTLSNILEEGLSLKRAVEIISSMAEALAEAHHHGIVHRDIKPSNVAITERGQVKVLDFGLVKNLFEQSTSGVDLDADTLYSTQTRSDVIVGTPLYLSPEQATGKKVDGRSDLFALGALLYECLTGQSAFSGSSVLEIGAQIIHVTPEPPSYINQRVPTELDRITLKALEKKTENRYQSAEEMLKDLNAVHARLSDDGIVASRRKRRAGVTTSALATLTTSLRRRRFSVASIIATVVITGLVIWGLIHFWPKSYYQPSPAALTWYERGTDALRNGAYYQASKALEQAITIDSHYSLAHARLAQAWSELDYIDRAKDELLVADRSSLSPIDTLYLDAITTTLRRDFDLAVKNYSEIAKRLPNDPQVYVDLGYAYENNGNVDKALENYLKAIDANSGQYATAFLRAGIVYNRKQNTAKATEFFDRAEQLYGAATNNEGVNEIRRQRGILLRDKGKYEEARTQFEKSLESARALGNEAQQISALIELSTLSTVQGQTADALDKAQQAVAFAQDKHLENFVAGGLIEVGNSFLDHGDYAQAEKYYKQAIDFAQSSKSRRREALARSNLGALYIQTQRMDQGLPLVEQALAFFQQENYPKNVAICLTQIARGYRRKGDYALALKALGQKLQIAQTGGSQPAIGDATTELAAVLFEQENYPEALEQYNKALDIYKALGSATKIAYNQANRTNILWRLGRYDEARQSLGEVTTAAAAMKALLPALRLVDAQISLSERNFGDARTKLNDALKLAGTDYPDTAIEATFALGLLQTLSGNGKDGVKLCDDSVKMASKGGDITLLSRAMLAQAEAALEAGDAQMALNTATEVQQRFAKWSQLESEWRAWVIASQASARLSQTDNAARQLAQAKTVCNQLQQNWGSDVFSKYISRPDIQVYFKKLG